MTGRASARRINRNVRTQGRELCTAKAGNTNATGQGVSQGQAAAGAGKHGSGQSQDAKVSNGTEQKASASVDNDQINIYAPVAVFSPGANSGPANQSNSATNIAQAGNTNATGQAVGQGQAVSTAGKHGKKGSSQTQKAGLVNSTNQGSKATVHNVQINIYAPVSVLSPGANSGPVNQSNSAFNGAAAFNLNETFQALFQSAGIHIFRF